MHFLPARARPLRMPIDGFTSRGLSKLVVSRVIIRVTPFRALITLLITWLLSPLPLQVVSIVVQFLV